MKRDPVSGDRPAAGKSGKPRRFSFDPGNMMLLLYPLVILAILLLGGLVRAAVPTGGGDTVSPYAQEIKSGELLLPDDLGRPVPAVMLSQEVNMTVTGVVARVKLVQEFRNPGNGWVNGMYLFPLPHDSAVDRLLMTIGEREVVGVIKEKGEAEAIYKKAAAQGRKTSLVSQQRPNMFTTRVANIGPGEKVRITIEYQQQALFRDKVFSLRFPMAVTPRYIPGNGLVDGEEVVRRDVSFDMNGWARNSGEVPDAAEITPPQLPATETGQPPVRFSIDFVAGFPLARLESLYHPLLKEQTAEHGYRLTSPEGLVPDRDFVLEWEHNSGEVSAALFHEDGGDERYMLLMLMPPVEKEQVSLPREVVFILDVSGSMAGPSIIQAKAALKKALDGLRPRDRFTIISFSSTAHTLFASSRMATYDNLAQAREYLAGLHAGGGTEMSSALRLALNGQERADRIRQVVFLTDGAVGNEQNLMKMIREKLGDSRLFTVGIGSAPNDYFMTRAASIGRGSFTFIAEVEEVEEKMGQLLDKLRYPAFTDISLVKEDGGEEMEVYPDPLPDLYHGEPLVVAVRRAEDDRTNLVLTGRSGGRRIELSVDTQNSGSRPGLASLWGRKKIRNLMESLALGADKGVIRGKVVQTALDHGLVSRYTSLVAVDTVVSRPEAEKAVKSTAPTPAPRGLQMQAVFGGGARTATAGRLQLAAGLSLLLIGMMFYFLNRRRPVWDRQR